jgi:uncharacterized membrane protein
MNSNVRKIMIIAAVLCIFFGTFFSIKYFEVTRETCKTIVIIILSLLILLQTFVKDDPKEKCKTKRK